MAGEYTSSGLRELVKNTNTVRHSKLSARKIRSKVNEIMSKPQDRWADLFVEYMRDLSDDIFKYASYYRTKGQANPYWGSMQIYQDANQFGITEATKAARSIINYCRRVIDPESDNKFDFEEKHYCAIRDWQKELLAPHTIYAETTRILKEWDEKAVDEAIKDVELSVGLKSDSPDRIHKYEGKIEDGDLDFTIASLYCNMYAFQEELDKHGTLWKWWFSNRVKAYNKYIDSAKNILEKVGFDIETHSKAVMDYVKTEKLMPYAMDVDSVNMQYKQAKEMLEAKSIPEIREARNYFEYADELNLDPEYAFTSKLAVYAEKYGMTASELVNRNVDWRQSSLDYDERRVKNGLTDNLDKIFLSALTKLFGRAGKAKGQDINVAEILQDAREIAILSAHFHTIAFSLDTVKDAEKPAYLKTMTPEYFAKRINFYLKDANLSDEVRAKLAKDGVDVINSWLQDPAKQKAEDEAFVRKNSHVGMDKEFSPVAQKIINSLLTVGYRPPEKTNYKLIEKHNQIVEKMRQKWFSDGRAHPDGADVIFAKNVEKLDALNKFMCDEIKDEAEVTLVCENNEREMKEKYPDYKPRKFEDLQGKNEGEGREAEGLIVNDNSLSQRHSIPVVLDDESKSLSSPVRENDDNKKILDKSV